MFRRYVTLHTGASIAVFAIAAVWTIISATRHSTAQSKCETTFFSTSNSTSTSSEGHTLCDIFAWVDVGVMAGAWVFFGLVQVSVGSIGHCNPYTYHTLQSYLLFVVSSYSTSQQQDHEKYEVLNDSTKPLTDEIPMADRGGPWDSRASYELDEGRDHGHTRQDSSTSTIIGVPPQKVPDGYDTYPSRPPPGGY